MNEQDKAELAETLATVLDEHRGVDADTHQKHHEYIETAIERNLESALFWRGVRKQVFGWTIIVIISGIGLAVADYFKHLIHMK